MEQSIDSNKKPEFAAGTDPAYIPGLTAPVPARTEDDEEAGTADGAPRVADEADIQDAVPVETSEPSGSAKPSDVQETAAGTADADAEDTVGEKSGDEPDDSDESADDDDSGAPVFEISDRRGSIRVDKAESGSPSTTSRPTSTGPRSPRSR